MADMSDPRRDRIFKQIFLNHPDSLIDLLNTFLPLESPIEGIEYMPAELMGPPHSARMGIVDVRCRDSDGRHFIVEMQIRRTPLLLQRLLWNAARILSMQLEKGGRFLGIQPVYTLCLLDQSLTPGGRWIHHFSLRSDGDAGLVMEGMHFTIVELSKWVKMGRFVKEDRRDAWMLFFTKPEAMREIYTEADWARYRAMFQAVAAWDLTRFTEDQLWYMNREIDIMITNNTFLHESYMEGVEEGEKKGMEKGLAEGEKTGMEKGFASMLAALQRIGVDAGVTDAELKAEFGLPDEVLVRLRSMASPSRGS